MLVMVQCREAQTAETLTILHWLGMTMHTLDSFQWLRAYKVLILHTTCTNKSCTNILTSGN